jgi:hypothetical protein
MHPEPSGGRAGARVAIMPKKEYFPKEKIQLTALATFFKKGSPRQALIKENSKDLISS